MDKELINRVMKAAMELAEKAEKEGEESVGYKLKDETPSSLSKVIKSKKQVDLFFKLLESL